MKIHYYDIANTISAVEDIRKIEPPTRYALHIARALRLAREAWSDFVTVRDKIIMDSGYKDVANLPEESRKEQEELNITALKVANAEIEEASKQVVDIALIPMKLEDEIGLSVKLAEATWWMWE